MLPLPAPGAHVCVTRLSLSEDLINLSEGSLLLRRHEASPGASDRAPDRTQGCLEQAAITS